MVSHGSVQLRQVVEADGIVRVSLAPRGAVDLQRLAAEEESGGVVSHRLVQHRQILQAIGVGRVVLSQMLESQIPGLNGEGHCLLIAALIIEPGPLNCRPTC